MVQKRFLKSGLSLAIHTAILASVAVLPSITYAEGFTPSAPQATSVPLSQSVKQGEVTAKKPTTLQTVEVTGSHIRQVDLATQEPIHTITHEEIVKTGLTTLGQVMDQMTTSGVSGVNSESVQGPDNIEQGGAFVNLRYLGSSRVLVLVNGKRWVTTPDGSTDLSSIPTAVIERVEVLKDGASAIYGSDAISGVINVITRTHFEGAQLNVGYGETDIGDWKQPHADLMLGSVSDKSSLLMDLSYSKVGAMWQRSRDLTKFGKGGIYHPTAAFYQTSPLGRFTDSSGTYLLNQLGDDTTNIANYTKINPANLPPEGTYNQFTQAQFRIPSTQASLYVSGRYNFNDSVSFNTTAMYMERRNVSQIGPYPLGRGIFRGMSGLISADSLYNPTDEDISFNILFPDLPRVTTHLIRTMHVNAGFEGDFSIGNSHDWHWDAYMNFNKESGTNQLHNQFNILYLQRGIGPSFINSAGVPTCGTPSDPLDTNQKQLPCNPINILAGEAGLTPEIRDNLIINPMDTFHFTEKSVAADITGGLFNIPVGGQVAIAAGVAARQETGYSRFELFKQRALTSTAANSNTDGEFSVRSGYVEINAPLLKDLPGVRLLDLDLATRYSHYSNFGSTTNSKIGIQYKPINDLLLRGTYSEAFRAPSISDIAGGDVEGFAGYTDPCDAKFGTAVYGSEVHETCVNELRKMGISNPDNFRELSHVGLPITVVDQEGNSLFTSGATPSLGPETAKTYTYGFVYSPSQVAGLTVSVNWWKIDLKNTITGITPDDVLRNCYLGEQTSCNAFHRNAITGQVMGLHSGLRNIGSEKLEGEDFHFSYKFPAMSIGQFTIGSNVTYMSSMQVEAKVGAPVQDLVGWNSSTYGPIWRIRSNTFLRWSRGSLSAAWRIRYFSSLREPCAFGTTSECSMPGHTDPFRGHSPTNRVGGVAYNGASVSWKDRDWGDVTLGVNNIFERKPPINYSGPSGEPPILSAYPVGRYWFVHYQKTF